MYPFRYCTVQEAKSYSGSEQSAEEILRQIELWSETINRITGKWFVPVYYSGEIEQLRDERFVMPNMVPIIEMSEPVIAEFSPNGGYEDIPYETETVTENVVGDAVEVNSLLYTRVSVAGYFGWLNHARAKVTTTVTISAAELSDILVLESTVGIKKNDIVLVDNYVSAIVCEVCDATRIKVDPIAEGVESGDTVVVFGRMLKDIVYCTQELVAKKGGGLQSQRNFQFQQMMVSETTDSYTYRLADPGARMYGIDSIGTGILEVDRMLMRYRTNADVRLV